MYNPDVDKLRRLEAANEGLKAGQVRLLDEVRELDLPLSSVRGQLQSLLEYHRGEYHTVTDGVRARHVPIVDVADSQAGRAKAAYESEIARLEQKRRDLASEREAINLKLRPRLMIAARCRAYLAQIGVRFDGRPGDRFAPPMNRPPTALTPAMGAYMGRGE